MKVEDGYLLCPREQKWINRNKKITGHTFVALAGLDRFKKPGDALLEMYRYIIPSIDPKWLKRGNFAEKVVQSVYKRDHTITTYDAAVINYDNFHELADFGGVIDIELLDEQTLVEVKSKSLKDYDRIVSAPPKSEVYQAALYAYLRGYEKFTMEYIFFDPETEKEVFEGKNPTTLKNLKRFSKTYALSELTDLEELLKKALDYRNKFLSEDKIPLSDVSEATLAELQKTGFLGSF